MIKKLKSKKGSERTLLAFIVVSIPIIYIFLIVSSWKMYDNQYKYMDNYLESTVSIITKTGSIHSNLNTQLKVNIEKILGSDGYSLEYFYTDYDNIKNALDNPSSTYPDPVKINNPVGQRFKTGDIIYLQLKSNKTPLYLRLLNFAPTSSDTQIIILHHGMVEVNAY